MNIQVKNKYFMVVMRISIVNYDAIIKIYIIYFPFLQLTCQTFIHIGKANHLLEGKCRNIISTIYPPYFV